MPALLAVPFVVLISGLVVIGLAAMSQSNSSAFTSWLRDNLGVLGTTLALGLQASISLSRWITNKLGQHFAGISQLTVGWVAGVYQYVERTGALALTWPVELFKVTYWLIWHEIPRMVKALPTAAGRVIHQTVTRVVKIERTVVKLPKLSKAAAKALIGAAVATYIAPYLSMLRWLKSHFHALTAVLPHTLPIPFGRTIAGIRARLRKLEKVAPVALGVAAVTFALRRLKLGCLLGRNGKMIGSRLCRVDSDLLSALLGVSIGVAGVVSVRALAREMLTLEEEAYRLLHKIIKEMPDPAKVTLTGATFPH